MPEPSEHANVSRGLEILARLRHLTLAGQHQERDRLLWASPEALRHYLHSFRLEGSGSEFVEDYVNDALARFFHTIRFVGQAEPTRVLELGGNPYLFTILLEKLFHVHLELANFFAPNVFDASLGAGSQTISSAAYGETRTYPYKTFNMELSDYPYPDESFDLVLFCEILEHLIVDPLAVFQKLRRVLRPGGKLLVTTPNAVRLVNFAFMLAGHNFFDRYKDSIYGRHNREFTALELRELLERNGFRIIELTTLDRHNYNEIDILTDSYAPQVEVPYTADALRDLLKRVGGDESERGDNIYALAERVD